MKKLAIIIIFVLAGYAGICAQTQCPDGSQCVKQSVIEKCADVADQLVLARDAITKLEAERSLSQAERQAAQTLIKGLNDLIVVKDRIVADYEQISKMKDGGHRPLPADGGEAHGPGQQAEIRLAKVPSGVEGNSIGGCGDHPRPRTLA